MKKITFCGNRLLSSALLVFVIVYFASCAKKIMFNTSAVVPAAEAKVKLKKDKNRNYDISLEVTHLADPTRLSPSKDSYIVWAVTENNGIKNIGQLKTGSSMFSSTMKGSLHAVTPFKPVKFFITAENDTDIQYPGTQVVLTTDSF